ncbi:MAG: nicotinate-nucleotide adenylyltransferase [Opitutales bacterium]
MLQAKQMRNEKRIGLYGGAFDPVHCAHLAIAQAAFDQLELDRLVFIPAAQSPLKGHLSFVSDSSRLKMLALAIEGAPQFSVDAWELERGGVSFTIDTVRHYRAREPEAELFWIIGADQFEQLDCWRSIEEMVTLVTFAVSARPAHTVHAPDISGLKFRLIDAPLMDHSSTAIRDRLANGDSVAGSLPESVEAFISAHQLYTQ